MHCIIEACIVLLKSFCFLCKKHTFKSSSVHHFKTLKSCSSDDFWVSRNGTSAQCRLMLGFKIKDYLAISKLFKKLNQFHMKKNYKNYKNFHRQTKLKQNISTLKTKIQLSQWVSWSMRPSSELESALIDTLTLRLFSFQFEQTFQFQCLWDLCLEIFLFLLGAKSVLTASW